MSFSDELLQAFPNRIERPQDIADIPSDVYFVYILTIDECPIVAGHGKKNRARVIFDSVELVTSGHFKAMTVRLYTLFEGTQSKFERYLIRCDTKDEAKRLETEIHRKFGGNTLSLSDELRTKLFEGIEERSPAWMALRMALCSSYDGISDLRKWQREGILDDRTWKVVTDKLKLKP